MESIHSVGMSGSRYNRVVCSIDVYMIWVISFVLDIGYIHPKYVHLQADAGLYSCSLGVFSHRLFPKARANVHVIQGKSA